MDDDTLCKISCQIVGSVLSSANWTTLCKLSWLTLVSGKGIWLPRTGREIHTSHSRFTGIMIVFPVLIPSQNFLFPGTGREITKCHGRGNLRLVFPGITGNGNSRSHLFWGSQNWALQHLSYQQSPHQVAQCFAISGPTTLLLLVSGGMKKWQYGLLNKQEGCHLFRLALIWLTTDCSVACFDLAYED